MSTSARKSTDVIQCTTRVIQLLVRKHELAKSKVSDFDIKERVFAENILWLHVIHQEKGNLDITMDNTHAMQIAQTICQWVNDAESFLFCKDRSTTDAIKQFASLEQLHNNVD